MHARSALLCALAAFGAGATREWKFGQESKDVREITNANMELLDGSNHALVFFYGPACSECDHFAATYAAVAAAARSSTLDVLVAAVSEEHANVTGTHDVHRVPALLFFEKGRQEADYEFGESFTGLTEESLMDFLKHHTTSFERMDEAEEHTDEVESAKKEDKEKEKEKSDAPQPKADAGHKEEDEAGHKEEEEETSEEESDDMDAELLEGLAEMNDDEEEETTTTEAPKEHPDTDVYHPSSDVKLLTHHELQQLCNPNCTKHVVLEFFADWCHHCRRLSATYSELAAMFKPEESVVVAAADGHTLESFSDAFQVEGYPTIFFLPLGEPLYWGIEYRKGHNLHDLVQFVNQHAHTDVKVPSSAQHITPPSALYSPSSAVQVVDSLQLHSAMAQGRHVMLEIFTDWCPHCQKFIPEWEKVADFMSAEGVRVLAVDADAEEDLVERLQIEAFPAVVMFMPNSKKFKEYHGDMEAYDIIQWARQDIGSNKDEL